MDFLLSIVFDAFINLLSAVVSMWKSPQKRYARAINAKEAVDLLNNTEAVLIDIRPAKSFNKSHIVESTNIPYENFIKAPQKLPKKPIIFVSENQAPSVMRLISHMRVQMPNRTVYIMDIANWRKAKLPLKTQETVVPNSV